MKVTRWKVLSIAGALVLGYAVTSNAAQIKVDENTFADFGYNMKIMYQKFDERFKYDTDLKVKDWKKNVFDVKDSRFYISGQVSKLVQFYGEWIAKGAYGSGIGGYADDNTVRLTEAGVNFVFMPEIQVRAGDIRVPFTRYQLTSGYSLIIPTDAWYDKGGSLAEGLFSEISGELLAPVSPLKLIGRTDGGLVVHGDLAGGMFRYNVGVFNEDKRLGKITEKGIDLRGKGFKDFQWVARVEFTPTMLGFSPESTTSPHGKVSDTYLGRKDVFTIGLGYMEEKLADKELYKKSDKSLKVKGWTVDALFEKKFGCWVPNLQLGYIKLNDSHLYNSTGGSGNFDKKGDTELWYVQGQLLYDAVVGIGKPALALRYEKVEADGRYLKDEVLKKDFTFDRWGAAFNYYIKGQAARVSLGFDKVKYKDAAAEYLKPTYDRSITDWYLYIQTMF